MKIATKENDSRMDSSKIQVVRKIGYSEKKNA